jgi:hypothetical protein
MGASNTRLNFYTNPYSDTGSLGNALFSKPELAQVPTFSKRDVPSSLGNATSLEQENNLRGKLVKKLNDPVYKEGKSDSEINKETGQQLLKSSADLLLDTTSKALTDPVTKEAIKTGVQKTGQVIKGLFDKGSQVGSAAVSTGSTIGTSATKVLADASAATASTAVKSAIDTGSKLSAATNTLKIAEPVGKLTVGAADTGMKAVDLGSKGAATASSGISAGASLGAGLATAAAGIGLSAWGDNLEKKAREKDDLKGYGWAKAAQYAGKGVSYGGTIGTTIGNMIVPGIGGFVGNLIGSGVGFVGGGIWGLISGNSEKKKILRERNEEQQKVSEANKRINDENYVTMTQYRDQMRQKNLMDSIGSNVAAAKKGGILLKKYANVSDAVIIEETTKEAPKKLNEVPIFKMGGALPEQSYVDFQKLKDEDKQKYVAAVYQLSQEGADIKNISKKTKLHPKVVQALQEYIAKSLEEQQQEQTTQPTQEYKRGGKMMLKKKVETCSCGCTPKFRRGGKLDIQKENIILDGPSHDEFNKTGVKGDKGMPVVKMTKGSSAFKVAEFEGGEMVLTNKVSTLIRNLRDEIKGGNEKAKEVLAELLQKELGNNTYDYTNLMS